MPIGILLALAVAVAQQAAGLYLPATHDGNFAVSTLHDFRMALAQGDFLPRWFAAGNGGLGSPLFFFYPLGAYAVPALAGLVWPELSDASAIGLGCLLFRAVSLLTCAAWLRRRTGLATALSGGALYVLMPYVAYVDPQMRLAFAETAAGAVLPLAFLAADAGGTRISKTVFLLAPVTACLALTHPPTAIIAAGLAAAYSTFSAASWREAATRALGTAGGGALGLCLAGAFLLPASVLQPAAQFWAMSVPMYLPENNFLFSSGIQEPFRSVLTAAVFLPMTAALLGWQRCRLAGVPVHRAGLLTLALTFFLLTPLSRPAWDWLPVLHRVQFPFRFALPLSLLAAAAAAPALRQVPRQWLLLAGLAWTALLAAAAWQAGDGRGGAVRTTEALASGRALAPEHIPATAPWYWQNYRAQGEEALRQAAARFSGCPAHRGLPLRIADGRITVGLLGCEGKVAIPQFWFPGWSGPDGMPPPAADPATGLIIMEVPPATDRIWLRRTELPEDRQGRQVTLLASGFWFLSAFAAFARVSPPFPAVRSLARHLSGPGRRSAGTTQVDKETVLSDTAV